MTQPEHIHTKCNGLHFRPSEARKAFYALKAEEALDLVPEPDNEYDRFAVMIVRRGTNLAERDATSHFGYVPKELAQRVGNAIRNPSKKVTAHKGAAGKEVVIVIETLDDEEERPIPSFDGKYLVDE